MIKSSHIVAMITHWLQTEPNGYFGSSYGAPIAKLFLRPLNSNMANEFLNKMKSDIPVLKQLDDDQLSIKTTNQGFERKVIILEIGDISIDLNTINESRKAQKLKGDTYDTNAI